MNPEMKMHYLNSYKVQVFTRFSKKIDVDAVSGRLCLKTENPMVESISVDNMRVISTSRYDYAGKAEVSLELNTSVTNRELEAICADICQRAMHKSITAILPWQDRHIQPSSN